MKTGIAIISAGLMSFGIVTSACATTYEFRPLSSSFTGTGTTSATKNGITLQCSATFKGKVNNVGQGSITSGTFTGALGCSSVGLKGLPWKAAAVSKTGAIIYNVTFTSPIGNCGPSNLKTTLSNGVVSFTNQALKGSCTVSGKLTTKPTLSIIA